MSVIDDFENEPHMSYDVDTLHEEYRKRVFTPKALELMNAALQPERQPQELPHRVSMALNRIMERIKVIAKHREVDERDSQFVENELLDVWEHHSIKPGQPQELKIPEDLRALHELAQQHRAWIRCAYDAVSEDGARISMWDLTTLIERVARAEGRQ